MNISALILSGIFWIVGAGLYLTSSVTTFWVHSFGGLSHHGLYAKCSPLICSNWDWNPSLVPSHVYISRLSMLTGGVILILGVVFGTIGIWRRNMFFILVAGSLHTLGGIIIWVGCALFTALLQFERKGHPSVHNSQQFHYSYYFGWVSGIMYILAGGCAIVAVKSQN